MKFKLIILNLFYLFYSCAVLAQTQSNNTIIDSLKNVLNTTTQDHERVLAMVALCNKLSTISFDSANKYGQQAMELAKQTNFISGEIKSLCFLGMANTRHGEMAKALQLQFRGLQIARDNKLETDEAICLFGIGHSYYFLRDNSNAINYCKKARQLFLNHKGEQYPFYSYFNPQNDKTQSIYTDNELVIGEAYLYSNQLDSAVVWLQKLYNQLTDPFWINTTKIFLGDAYFKSGKQQLGLQYLRESVKFSWGLQHHYNLAWSYTILSECFKKINQVDSSIFYAKLGLSEAQQVGFKNRILGISQLLADEYEHININESHKYLKLAFTTNNELFGPQKVFELQKTLAEQQKHQVEAEKQQIAYKNRIRQNALIAGLSVILIIALILYGSNKQKQKAKLKIEKAYKDLQSTQQQLIQSEKMASLGELTAGIAHEIQNPLNFVNNFSEVNTELIEELKTELATGNQQEAIEIANNIKDNEEKINHHGKRADAIVKGMLQHSRSSSGQKEPTDSNALADEYLRLAYHGLRAKDKSFNATMKTDYDEAIGKINIIPQDIGRVILNLINNAFYAVSEKKALRQAQGDNSYEPTVTVSTSHSLSIGEGRGQVQIKVSDNGNGIPQKVLDKIFQPFFTTKPTGQGTGLGLSLSYDIVKAHGGEIKVETKEDKGTTFIILLPT